MAKTTETELYKQNDNNYRRRITTVSAFKWDGTTRDPHGLPPWVRQLCRSATLNEATDPPGLILDTLLFGNIQIRHDCWFVYDPLTSNMFTRADEVFKRDFEPNV